MGKDESLRKNMDRIRRIFPHVPENEVMKYDCSCALFIYIHLQGKMYVTNHTIYYTGVFGVKVVIPLRDVTGIELDQIGLIHNAVKITTNLGKQYRFGTLTDRKKTFDNLCTIWKNEPPPKPDKRFDNMVDCLAALTREQDCQMMLEHFKIPVEVTDDIKRREDRTDDVQTSQDENVVTTNEDTAKAIFEHLKSTGKLSPGYSTPLLKVYENEENLEAAQLMLNYLTDRYKSYSRTNLIKQMESYRHQVEKLKAEKEDLLAQLQTPSAEKKERMVAVDINNPTLDDQAPGEEFFDGRKLSTNSSYGQFKVTTASEITLENARKVAVFFDFSPVEIESLMTTNPGLDLIQKLEEKGKISETCIDNLVNALVKSGLGGIALKVRNLYSSVG